MINEARSKLDGFPPLELVFCDMVLASKEEAGAKEFSNKTSST